METWINRNLLCNRYQKNQLLVYNYLTRVWLLFIINHFLKFGVLRVWLSDKQHQQFPRKLARNTNSQVWHQITSWIGNAEVRTSNLYFNKSSGFPGGSGVKVASLGREDPWRRAWRPTPVFLPAEFHGQSSLVTVHGSQSVGHNWVINTIHKGDSEVRKLWGALFLEISFWLHRAACRILGPWTGIEPTPLAVEAQSLNHWTTREVPEVHCLICFTVKMLSCSSLRYFLNSKNFKTKKDYFKSMFSTNVELSQLFSYFYTPELF